MLTIQLIGTFAILFPTVIHGQSSQGTVRCPRLPKLWNGDVLESCLRVVGSQCHFSCKKPYVLKGTENRTCLENATWSGESPSCELEGGQCSECHSDSKFEKQVAVSCPSLVPPPGGALRGTCNPGQVGASCVFVCPSQTILVGQPVLVCLSTGAWSDSPPTCRGGGTGGSGTCRTLTPPPGGRLVGSCATPVTGDICQLVCISGFRPSDTRVLVCQQNGAWSDSLPTCIGSGNQCPSVVVPQATLSGTCNPGIPGQSCTITCRSGFTVISSTTITCQQTGTWSGQIPTCAVRACPALQPSPNSVLSGSCTQASVGQTCTYTCLPGYQLVGQSTLVCLPGSTWSSGPPACRMNFCPALPPPLNGGQTGSCTQATTGQTCSFVCNPGYVLSGLQNLFCGANGQWSSPAPTCTPIECPDLTAPANGALSGSCSKAVFNASCTFSCQTGYRLLGEATLVCLADGRWSAERPCCNRTGCPALPTPTFGFQSGSCRGALPGQSCIFSCQPGYELVGQSTLICQNSGAWTGGVPTCSIRRVTCPTLVAINNGFAIGTCAPGQVGQSCVFGCNQNYVLEGQRTLICQANGMWNGNIPRCVSGQSDECPSLIPPLNGEFVECDNRIGGRCVVNCLRGFVRSGSRVRTCLQQGTWSGFAPVCTRRPVIGYKVVPLWSFLFG